jgi:hypothetical protein
MIAIEILILISILIFFEETSNELDEIDENPEEEEQI